MPKIILYIAQSLDGYIADENGGIEWLNQFNNIDYGYENFIKNIDIVILGSKTFEQVLTFGEYPYKNIKSIVYTNRKLKNIKGADITFLNYFTTDFYNQFNAKTNIWLVGGAKIINTFLENNLISEFWIFTIPVVLGNGIPLFKPGNKHFLKLVDSKTFKNGVLLSTYSK